jgi:hypothetical protein
MDLPVGELRAGISGARVGASSERASANSVWASSARSSCRASARARVGADVSGASSPWVYEVVTAGPASSADVGGASSDRRAGVRRRLEKTLRVALRPRAGGLGAELATSGAWRRRSGRQQDACGRTGR